MLHVDDVKLAIFLHHYFPLCIFLSSFFPSCLYFHHNLAYLLNKILLFWLLELHYPSLSFFLCIASTKKGKHSVQSLLQRESIINQCPTECLCEADGMRHLVWWLASLFGFMLEESLISFVFSLTKSGLQQKKTPRQDNLLARLCLLLRCYDNYKYMTFIRHDLTVYYGGGALLPPRLKVNFPALFMSLWIQKLRYRRGGWGGQGFLIVIGQGSSIWKFWSGGLFWTVPRSKHSDVAI